MREHKIEVNHDKCIGCGMCQSDCPAYNITIEDKKAVIKTQSCILCGHCVAVCPKAAVSITGFDQPPMEMEKPAILDPRQLMEAGRLTPTGGNTQNVSYIVLQDEISRYEQIAVKLAKKLLPLVKLVNPTARNAVIDGHFFFKSAPVVIAVVSKDKINASLAASNMELMAEAHGLGVLYSGFFAMVANRSLKLKKEFSLSRGERIVTALVIGYPNVNYRRTAQKDAAAVRYL